MTRKKESKEAILELLGFISFQVPIEKQEEWKEMLNTIQKDLEKLEKYEKALEIITTRYVDLQCLFCAGYKEYNFHRDRKFHVSKEEFDLLKEVSK